MPIYEVVRGKLSRNGKTFGKGKRINMKVEEAEQLVKDRRLIDVKNIPLTDEEKIQADKGAENKAALEAEAKKVEEAKKAEALGEDAKPTKEQLEAGEKMEAE